VGLDGKASTACVQSGTKVYPVTELLLGGLECVAREYVGCFGWVENVSLHYGPPSHLHFGPRMQARPTM